TLSNLALVYRQLDRDNDSEVVLNDALKIYRRAGAPEPIASTIGTLAAYKAAAGNIPEAVAMFDEAFNMVRSFAPADLPLTFLLHRLDLMLQRGELPAARAFVDECFSGASPSPLQRLRFVLPARVRIALYEHDVAAARATFQEAMDLLQQE